MKKRTWFLAAILSLSALPLMTGCGSSIASDSEIKEDLLSVIEENGYFEGLNPEITSFEIEKRKTDDDAKTDVVYVWADVKDDVKESHVGYLLTYTEYNDGWEFERSEPYGFYEGKWESEPINVLPEEMLTEDFDVYYDEEDYSMKNVTDKDEALKNKQFTAEFVKVDDYELYDGVYTKELTYNWESFYMQWMYSEDDSDSSYENVWDAEVLAGTWRTNDGSCELVFANENGEAKLESATAKIMYEYTEYKYNPKGEKKEIELIFDKVTEDSYDSFEYIVFDNTEYEEKYYIDSPYVRIREDGIFFNVSQYEDNDIQLFKAE